MSAANGVIGFIIFLPGIFVEYQTPVGAKGYSPDGTVKLETSGEILDGEEQPDRIKQLDEDGNSIISSNDSGSVKDDEAAAIATAAAAKQNKKPRELLKQFSRVSVLDGHYTDVKEDLEENISVTSEGTDRYNNVEGVLLFIKEPYLSSLPVLSLAS